MKCPQCKIDRSKATVPGTEKYIKERGVCDTCWEENLPLIKRKEGYYVPGGYDIWPDTMEERIPNDCEDEKARPPRIEWSENKQKWALVFDSADCGGYDVQSFIYYFDTKKDIYAFLEEEN